MDQNPDDKHFELFGLTFPIYQSFLIKTTIGVWIAMLLILLVGMTFFGYEMTNADLPMGAIAGFLFAYLLTIIAR